MALKAILFDAVGTLMQPDPGVALAYHRVGTQHGSRHALDEVDRRFRRAFAREEQHDRDVELHRTCQERELERWRSIVAEVFDDVADFNALFIDLWKHFARAEHWRLTDDAAEVWSTLSQQGLRLGIASNFDDRLDKICRRLEPFTSCRDVFASSRLRVRKPHVDFFRRIERHLGCQSDELMLVGDDEQNDYQAARAAGWRAVLIDPAVETSDGERIARLGDLPSLLDNVVTQTVDALNNNRR